MCAHFWSEISHWRTFGSNLWCSYISGLKPAPPMVMYLETVALCDRNCPHWLKLLWECGAVTFIDLPWQPWRNRESCEKGPSQVMCMKPFKVLLYLKNVAVWINLEEALQFSVVFSVHPALQLHHIHSCSHGYTWGTSIRHFQEKEGKGHVRKPVFKVSIITCFSGGNRMAPVGLIPQ